MAAVTRTEWQALASLLALVAIFAWFQMRMMDGWTIVDQPAAKLFGIYIVVIAFSAFAEILIASLGAAIDGKRVVKDERDLAIDARANQNERIFIIVAVNVLIWQALMEEVFAGHALPKIDLTSLPELFFFLFAILFGGEIVKRLSTLWLYRLQSALSDA
ncbi:MAG: hypothetical protein U5J99_01160 [Parvularculaceae bacterium]|nr:hypothetical protein [Parvularculaceae bacterium]